jgi:hypothetical protein
MDSCRELFKTMKILPLYSQHIFSLLTYSRMWWTTNIYLQKNLDVRNHDTRSANNFHLPIINLTIYQKGAYYTGIKIFNYLPTHIQNAANEIQVFKKTKRFLLDNSFHSIDKYFNAKN